MFVFFSLSGKSGKSIFDFCRDYARMRFGGKFFLCQAKDKYLVGSEGQGLC
jgi:hypothetical protein